MIIAVTNQQLCPHNFLEQIKQIAKANPYGIILREKHLPLAEYSDLAKQCITELAPYNTKLIINSNISVAQGLSVKDIQVPMISFMKNKDTLKGFNTVGVSIHSVDEAKFAEKLGATYLIAGHIYNTQCKSGIPPRGISFLKNVCDSVNIPVFAIGGITMDKIFYIKKAGAKGICIMSELMKASNPTERILAYNDKFDNCSYLSPYI